MNNRILQRRDLILSGNLMKALLILAIPVAINNLIIATYNLIDTFFVAHIGSMEVAAITFVGPINRTVQAISMGLAVGGTNLVAREIGREDYQQTKRVMKNLVEIALILGVLVTVITLMFSKSILTAASATPDIMTIADLYFRITMFSMPFAFFNAAFLGIKRANGETDKAMIINIIAIIVKVIVTYVLIFHMGMGVVSLAISTIVGQVLVTVFGVYDLYIKQTVLRLDIRFGLSSTVSKHLMVIGFPVIIERASSSFGFIVVNKYILAFGEKVLASYGITNSINSLFFSLVTGFATGLSPFISQNLGAGQEERAKTAIKKTFMVTLSVAIVCISIVLPIRGSIIQWFSSGDGEILNHTMNAMAVYSVSVIPWAVFQVCIGVFQGTGKTKYSMYISIARIYLFRVPLVMILTSVASLGEFSIWVTMLISNCMTGVFALLLYKRTHNSLQLAGE